MATSKAKKNHQLDELKKKFEKSEGIAFVRFDGPSVMDVQQIRRDLRAQGMSYTVIKKTLIALAAKEANAGEFQSADLEGAVAVIVSDNDAIAPAAAIKKLKKEFTDKETKTSKFDFAGAMFEGKFLDPGAAALLADTPTIEESYAKIIAMLRSGPQGIHSMLTHGLRGVTMACKEADKFSTAS